MALIYFDEGQRPNIPDEDVMGQFYEAGDNREMLAYIHRDWKNGDDLPILDAIPEDLAKMQELLYTRSFLMTEKMAKQFMKVFNDMAEAYETEDGSVDSSEG